MGWLIALGVLVVLACLPVGVRIVYDAQGFALRVLAGPLRILLYPRLKVGTNSKRGAPTQQAAKKTTGKTKTKSGGAITDFLPLVKTALTFLNAFRKKLRIAQLEMLLTLGGSDPCDLSVNYGRGWAILGNVVPLIESLFVIKKRDLEIACDYNSDQTTVYLLADFTITVGRLLYIALRYGMVALKQYLNIKKGGAQNESKSS